MKFSCGHKTFTFPSSALVYYPWLDHLFGNGNIGEPKTELTNNLMDYMSSIPPHIVRNILQCISYLESLYNEDVSLHNGEVDFDLVAKVEHFLANGPGMTKGLDIPYTCKKCSKKSMIPTHEMYLPHQIVHHDNYSICVNCGLNWWSGISRRTSICNYSMYTRDACLHIWE
jgi:hypothetical protein